MPLSRQLTLFLARAGALGFLCAALAPAPSAVAEGAYCSDLKAEIARLAEDRGSARYRAAAVKQQREYARTQAYAQSIGCDRQQFLFFGDAPPAQCPSLNARMAQMRANLGQLQQGGDDSRRQALIARYNDQCRERPAAAAAAAGPLPRGGRPRNFFEELFGVTPPSEEAPTIPFDEPAGPAQPFPEDRGEPTEFDDGRTRGGSLGICVRSCDGGFFPVSYSAKRANLDELNSLCRALCPGTEAALYTKSPSSELEKAVSLDGALYSELPNALKFQKSFDAGCSCRPPGKSWAEALADAEQMLAAVHEKDSVVTPEQAERLSQPVGVGLSLRGSGTPRGAAGGSPVAPAGDARKSGGDEPSVYREVTGPDGVKRRVRVVAPTL